MRTATRLFTLLLAAVVGLGCRGPSEGPVKGVLVVYPQDLEEEVDAALEELQRYLTTVDREPVFNFSSAYLEDFEGSLRMRRTILFLTEKASQIPGELASADGLYRARDVWASDQLVYGAVLPDVTNMDALSDSLLKAYNLHMRDFIYGSFVATQMSSPERIDSLRELGFTIDVPKSYSTEVWRPEEGFVQYQRFDSESCALMLSIRWKPAEDGIGSGEEAMRWREAVARRFFYDAQEDSVDRAKTTASPMVLDGAEGLELLGVWRNPEHLNAGAFTSYLLRHGDRKYLIDFEVYYPEGQKEPYIREGWTIMNTFVPGS